jgi:hypothetical protein
MSWAWMKERAERRWRDHCKRRGRWLGVMLVEVEAEVEG